MFTKVPLSTDVTDPICLAPFLAIIFLDFWTVSPQSRQRCRYLDLEFASVVETGKIGEEGYNIVLVKARNSTRSSHLRSAERKRLLTL
ncbi:hypothetical protein AVEN_13999-1 [Araneus ventricosus]|uniref:Uncharacterized protein n=1 Tax=Araneus ventricosus TaxID=182803 RepID=A0A4Y2QLP2_ARAVE|nr:hypothetical protein AVEN_13999-1 [Araneus ventricosus]